jgi:predicted methyltransferase
MRFAVVLCVPASDSILNLHRCRWLNPRETNDSIAARIKVWIGRNQQCIYALPDQECECCIHFPSVLALATTIH